MDLTCFSKTEIVTENVLIKSSEILFILLTWIILKTILVTKNKGYREIANLLIFGYFFGCAARHCT
jgi:hypothetical protein